MLREFTSHSVPKKCQHSPNTIWLGSKGFEISDCLFLANDLEVTESCNNSKLFSFLMHSYSYLEIMNDQTMVGKYCGKRTGQSVFLTGDQIVITFHSSSNLPTRRGFLIHFNVGPPSKYFS